jgi:hypothetical protein
MRRPSALEAVANADNLMLGAAASLFMQKPTAGLLPSASFRTSTTNEIRVFQASGTLSRRLSYSVGQAIPPRTLHGLSHLSLRKPRPLAGLSFEGIG